MAFTQKLINVTFQLGTGDFGEGGFNVVKVSGLRCSATVTKVGGSSMGTLLLRIFGLTFDMTGRLTTMGLLTTAVRRNTILIEAGDTEPLGTVFIGTITNAYADYDGAPNVVFTVQAYVGLLEAMKPIPPSSYRGAADVAAIMASLATQMDLAFENSGVSGVTLLDPYFPGTAREQARACAEHSGISWTIDNGKLAIWPAGQARGTQIPVISSDTGMIGYPAFSPQGIIVRALFNPSITFMQRIQVNSSIKAATGQWDIFELTYDLESMTLGGKWMMTIGATWPGYAAVSARG